MTMAELGARNEWLRPRKGVYRNDRYEVTHDPDGVIHEAPEGMTLGRARSSKFDDLIRTTAGQVEVILNKSRTPWRRVDSLAAELDLDEAIIREALDFLGSSVRRPVGARGREVDYYAPADRELTWQEKWRIFRAMISRMPLKS